jgi:hypothetical protein
VTLAETETEQAARLRMQRAASHGAAYETAQPALRHPAARIDRNAADLEGKDFLAIGVAAFMTLAPLAAAAYGIGM